MSVLLTNLVRFPSVSGSFLLTVCYAEEFKSKLNHFLNLLAVMGPLHLLENHVRLLHTEITRDFYM